MGLKILKGLDELRSVAKERIIIYGRAGIGKTRLALSLTPRFGKIAYYAADKNSELLSSVDPKKHERVVVVVPEGDDPIRNFMEFAMHDWSKEDPEIKTLVVDTYTKVAVESIRHSANTGSVTAEKHYKVGDPNHGGQVIPNRGDYLAIESISRGFLDMLFDKQRNKHVILVCHEDIKIVENIHAIGGPAHPGRTMTEELPGQFSTVIRLIRDEIITPGSQNPEDVVVAISDHDGKFIAKMRTTNEREANPLARVILDRTSENYWIKYDSIYAPKELSNV